MSHTPVSQLGCHCCTISRRKVLAAGCAGCAAGVGLTRAWAAESAPVAADSTKPVVRLCFALFGLKQPRPTWPHVGFDFQPVIDQVTADLKRLCPNVELLPTPVFTEDEAKKIVADDKQGKIDGYVVYQCNNWIRVMQHIASAGKPTIIADFNFAGSGGFLLFTSALRREHKNISVVSSSKIEDLAEAIRCFDIVRRGGSTEEFVAACDKVRLARTPKLASLDCRPDPVKTADPTEVLRRMKESTIIVVRQQTEGPPEHMGIRMVYVNHAELQALADVADLDRARSIAADWVKRAAKIDIPDQGATLEKSARLYLGMQAMLRKHNADAITIDCLGGFYTNKLQAYPCLGFLELLDEGRIGACEADVLSTGTQVAMSHLAPHRPGYISDPVIDTSGRQIIYAHCVATTRVFGPQGPANKFEILTHAEDQRGASVRSYMPEGYMTTSLKMDPNKKQIVLHQARSAGNVVVDRACRTKLAAEVVGDIEKLFTYWDAWGWHRVTFYGDLKEPVQGLADALGFKVIEEA